MTTLKVNTESKQAKAFIELVKTFDFVTIIDSEPETSSMEEPKEEEYNPKFVETVLNSFKNDKRTIIESSNLWESI